MKSLINNPVKVFATGFIILLFLSLPLFWIRCWCEIWLIGRMPQRAKQVSITPSGLLPPEFEKDPNLAHHSTVSADMRPEFPISPGITDYFEAIRPGGRHSNIYYYEDEEAWIYFDEKIGQIVRRWTDTQRMPDGTSMRKRVQLYIGTEGVSEIPDKTLGRFIDPIIDSKHINPLILYDKKLRRFFKIDFNERTVIKGPKLSKDDFHRPLQIGLLRKNPFFVSLHWLAPQVEVFDEESLSMRNLESVTRRIYSSSLTPYLLVLDESGRVEILDKEKLAFAGTFGYLVAPETFFPSKRSVTPKDLLSYQVEPLFLGPYDQRLELEMVHERASREAIPLGLDFKSGWKYLGMFVAAVSRERTAMALAVFDAEGKLIKSGYTETTKYEGRHTVTIPSSKAVFFEAPWAPVSTIGKYLAENLHPPILSIASYFTASVFEAGAGHRALFFLPNSFIAMKGRDTHGNIAERFTSALLLILPSIILAVLLAWRVSKNAAVVGLSKNVRLFWIIGTIAFGLTAYLTYRLTKPKVTLVTCANCGNPRRPDMDRCHRCGSKWHVPELTPPTWRVLDGGQQVHKGLSVQPEEAAAE